LRSGLPNSKRDKIACVKIIGENMGKNVDLSDLECEIDIQNFSILVFVSAIIIIREKNKKTDLFKWRESQKRILKKKVEKKVKLIISKIIRFGTFRNIEDKDDNIEIVDYMPILNERTKSPKIMLEEKKDIIAIKRKPSKKR
jgi:hypothetical protein